VNNDFLLFIGKKMLLKIFIKIHSIQTLTQIVEGRYGPFAPLVGALDFDCGSDGLLSISMIDT